MGIYLRRCKVFVTENVFNKKNINAALLIHERCGSVTELMS